MDEIIKTIDALVAQCDGLENMEQEAVEELGHMVWNVHMYMHKALKMGRKPRVGRGKKYRSETHTQ